MALSYVRCLLLRSTFAATAPRSAVAELRVVSRCSHTFLLPGVFSEACFEFDDLLPFPSFLCPQRTPVPGSQRRVSRLLFVSYFSRHSFLSGVARFSAGHGHGRQLVLARPYAFATLSPHASHATNATANHALQRTVPRVTLAAIHVRCRLVRAGRGHTSVASFFASPSQPSRRAPRSLSLRSLGASARTL